MSNFGSYNVDPGAVRRDIEKKGKGGKKTYKPNPKPVSKKKAKKGKK